MLRSLPGGLPWASQHRFGFKFYTVSIVQLLMYIMMLYDNTMYPRNPRYRCHSTSAWVSFWISRRRHFCGCLEVGREVSCPLGRQCSLIGYVSLPLFWFRDLPGIEKHRTSSPLAAAPGRTPMQHFRNERGGSEKCGDCCMYGITKKLYSGRPECSQLVCNHIFEVRAPQPPRAS